MTLFGAQPEDRSAILHLDQLQAEWRVQLRSYKHHVEAKAR